tara:strand:+ start:225 stop:467 length:243 start_codon:yes stop_codon:yes gene_type:complete
MQINNLETLLTWLKSSPFKFTISSMSGGFVHVKFLIPFVMPDMDILKAKNKEDYESCLKFVESNDLYQTPTDDKEDKSDG